MNENKYTLLDDKELNTVSGGTYGPTDHTVPVNQNNFKSVISSSSIVYIVFGASWAGPCVSYKGTVEAFATEYDTALVGIVDVDENEDLCRELNVTTIPTTIKYVMATEVERYVGSMSIGEMFKTVVFF